MKQPEWTTFATKFDDAFVAAVVDWMRFSEEAFIEHIWAGYEVMERTRPPVDGRDLERSITQILDNMIRDEMSGDEPYYIQHGPYERETMARPPAQPPAYDLAFVFRADPRVMWPVEAKVLETPRTLAPYLADIRNEFLTCRYGPFSPSGAMLAYLLAGRTSDVLVNVEARLNSPLVPVGTQHARASSKSTHSRVVPPGKAYPRTFDCYHIVLSFHGLQRVLVEGQHLE
ncbi:MULTISPECIES: hypothetical protein [unclassified Rhizobium]|uniref:hypothetical protein n=1 Tax=unclassified Rhizobium TaxID=2613769 RepID=UPI00185B2EF7|nr:MULTISPECIES: hypothetical protein [unclassified Rhizobium]MBB3525932.1 hypothetical protein [Rhizobium sp. BK456]